MTVLIPPVINEFLSENNFGSVDIEDLSVYTVAKDSYSDDMYVNTAVVIDNEDDVILRWTYVFEDSRFIVEVDTIPYEVLALCALVEDGDSALED